MTSFASLLLAAAATAAPDYGAILETQRHRQDVVGVSATVVVGDDVVFAGGAGFRDLETREPALADTAFYLGSISKVFTAVFALELAEDGRLALDEPLGFRQRGPGITPAELLSHGSGLSREGPWGYWFSAAFPTTTELVDYASDAELAFEPGSDMRYSNVAYAVLGYAAAQRVDLEFEAALEQTIFEPLGMASTGARGPAPNVSRGYAPPGRLIPSDERPFAGVGANVGDRRLREYHDALGMAPAFGAYSTASDMGRFLAFLLGSDDGRRVIERLLDVQATGWGLGLEPDRVAGRDVGRHSGWFAAHRSLLLVDPETGIGVIVMANSDNANTPAIAMALFRAALAARSTSGSP